MKKMRKDKRLLVFSIIILVAVISAGAVFALVDMFLKIEGISQRELVEGGIDEFNSSARVTVQIPCREGEVRAIDLFGPTVVQRGPMEVLGPDSDMYEIPIEIVAMSLQSADGMILLTESPTLQSTGKVTGELDPESEPLFPAASFFDVFFEIQIAESKLKNAEAARLNATIDGIPPPDNPFVSGPTNIPVFDENETEIGCVIDVVHIPNPTPEQKLSKIVIKMLNRIKKELIKIEKKSDFIKENMNLGATKSFNVTIPAGTTVIVGYPQIQNPFERDSNIKICVDASSLYGASNSEVELKVDVAGDGDFTTYKTTKGGQLTLLSNTCYEFAGKEFQLVMHDGHTTKSWKNKTLDVEIAIVWSTGAKIV
jgi:hypothetical protein